MNGKMKIYILKLEHGKYYIGKTNVPLQERISQHYAGNGAEWTKIHPVVEVFDVISVCNAFDEDKYTKMYMAEYGIDNVRGGSYCQIELSSTQKHLLSLELNHVQDKCLLCGDDKHFSKDCPSKNVKFYPPKTNQSVCYKCGTKGHYANKCYVNTHKAKKRNYAKRKQKEWNDDSSYVIYNNFGVYSYNSKKSKNFDNNMTSIKYTYT